MAELRRVEEVLQDTTRQLHAAEGEEEALRAKVGHLRHEADIAQAACDRARDAEVAALKVQHWLASGNLIPPFHLLPSCLQRGSVKHCMTACLIHQ